jgi:hypothetical protein
MSLTVNNHHPSQFLRLRKSGCFCLGLQQHPVDNDIPPRLF